MTDRSQSTIPRLDLGHLFLAIIKTRQPVRVAHGIHTISRISDQVRLKFGEVPGKSPECHCLSCFLSSGDIANIRDFGVRVRAALVSYYVIV